MISTETEKLLDSGAKDILDHLKLLSNIDATRLEMAKHYFISSVLRRIYQQGLLDATKKFLRKASELEARNGNHVEAK